MPGLDTPIWVQILALPLPGYVPLGKLLNFSKSICLEIWQGNRHLDSGAYSKALYSVWVQLMLVDP